MSIDEIADVFIIVLIWLIPVVYIINEIKRKKRRKRFQHEKLVKTCEKYYCRDIPFEDLGVAFYLGTHYGLIDNPSNIFSAVILKWLKEDKIKLIKNADGTSSINMQELFKKDDNYERDIYIELLIASGEDHILSSRDFEYYFANNEEHLRKFFKKLIREVEEKLTEKGVLKSECVDFKSGDFIFKLTLNEKLEQSLKNMEGLKNFLEDFSLIHEKEVTSINLWDDYLIYAALFGIADKVEDELYHLYPKYYEKSKLMNLIYTFTFCISFPLQVVLSMFLKEDSNGK